MQAAPSVSNYTSEVNKHNSCQNARKVPARRSLTRLGQIEKLVLQYATEIADTFSPSDVVVYYNLKDEHGSNANKRVYDAVQRLLRRGILEKVSRGLYRLAVDVPAPPLGEEVKENRFRSQPPYPPAVPRASRRYLVRFHMSPTDGGLVGAYVRAYVVRAVVSHALRGLELRVIQVYGRSYLRRLRAWLARSVDLRASALGVHGRYGRRDARLLRFSYLETGFSYEVGMDAVVDLPVDKLSAKVYLRDVSRNRTLLEYVEHLMAVPRGA